MYEHMPILIVVMLIFRLRIGIRLTKQGRDFEIGNASFAT